MNRFLILLILAGMAQAHSGNRLYPFYELTDEMLEKIDIHDGFIDEWYEIGEPNKNTHDESGEGILGVIHLNYSIVLYLDADHSGGRGFVDGYGVLEDRVQIYGRTQKYDAIPQAVSGPTFSNGHSYLQPWHTFPPYGDAGGGVAGGNPVVWIVEMYVTPQDGWGDSMDETPFSELSAHQIVGFAPVIYDCDPSVRSAAIPWNPEAIDDEDAFLRLYQTMADIFLDGLLVPAPDTAVESDTWGRIKASLQ